MEQLPPSAEGSQNDKIDQITALQDGIDGLSLAMFEALRGLRDAVAPESGNLGGGAGGAGAGGGDGAAAAEGGANAGAGGANGGPTRTSVDFEEFFRNYRNGDSDTIAAIEKVRGTLKGVFLKREDLMKIHNQIETEKDKELVSTLANTVLEKSKQIDERVSSLPGMDRTKAQQMKLIEELIESNKQAAQELEQAYDEAKQKRDEVRKFIADHTCEALGIVVTEEEDDDEDVE